MDIILVAGLWLPRSIWDPVVDELGRLGHHAVAPALPGVDDASTSATLADQVHAVLAAVDAASMPMVVGHSAAASLAWMVADRRPANVGRVVLVGGFPLPDGATYADFFPVVDGVMAFPGWEPFAGPDSDDVDAAARQRIEDAAVPVLGAVAAAPVRLMDDARFDVPVTLVCPEFSPTQAQGWIDEGAIPELGRVRHLDLVDLDSGHWPMVSCPARFAALLDTVARRSGRSAASPSG